MNVLCDIGPGDLVKDKRGGRLGIIVEIFGDLNPKDAWVRVRWTTPYNSYEWCKQSGLILINNQDIESKEDP